MTIRVMGLMDAETNHKIKQSISLAMTTTWCLAVSPPGLETGSAFVSKKAEPARWKVLDGASEFYFRSYTEATNFCQMRGYIFMKGGKQHEAN